MEERWPVVSGVRSSASWLHIRAVNYIGFTTSAATGPLNNLVSGTREHLSLKIEIIAGYDMMGFRDEIFGREYRDNH